MFKVHKKSRNIHVKKLIIMLIQPLQKIEISSNDQHCYILSQNVPKFEIHMDNDELFNMYYGIFSEI
jgi:hypothetical protein